MPTPEEDDSFWRDYRALSADEQVRFRQAVLKFAEDLDRGGPIRGGLRVSEEGWCLPQQGERCPSGTQGGLGLKARHWR